MKVYAPGLTVEVFDKAVDPPAPTPTGQFDSVSLVGTFAMAPTTVAPGTRLLINLHGTGSWSAIDELGLQYKADAQWLSDVAGESFRFGVQEYGADILLRPQAGATGTGPHGDWLGWMVGDKMVPYQARRLDAMLEWTFAQYPALSRTKTVLSGSSIGGWAALQYGLRRPDKFAYVMAALANWRFAKNGLVRVPMRGNVSEYVTVDAAPEVDGFGGTLAEYDDMVAYVADPANEIPFVAWFIGKQDPYTLFDDHIAAVDALRATKRGFVFGWKDEGHSTAIDLGYDTKLFEVGKGYPIFHGSSLDQDPRVDSAGFINKGFKWRNLVETADSWSCEIANSVGAVTVSVLPHSKVFLASVDPVALIVPAGAWAAVSFTKAVDPPPVEPPAPPPVEPPPPAPEPPPPSERPAGMTRILTSARFVCFTEWNAGARYERWQELEVLRGQVSLKFNALASSGARLPFQGGTYTLCGGKNGDEPIVSVTPPVGALIASFDFDASTLAEGWHVMDIQGPDVAAFYPMFVLHGDTAPPQQWMPVCTGTYTHKGINGTHRLEWVPAVHQPTVLPLPRRAYPHFSDLKPRAQLWRDEIVPVRNGDIYRPNISKEGILSTANMQWYTWSHFIAKLPAYPLLDGPRGVGTMGGITHCEIGTFVNPRTGVTGGILYVLDSWRVAKIRPTGEIVTLVGYRHKPTPSHHEDPPELELVGDWSAIPEERRGFHETWGMCWDPSSLITDESAQPIPEEGNLRPHTGGGPVMFVSDSQNNRVCRIQFVGGSSSRGMDARHGVPPVVTEFLTGLGDPWDVVEWQGKLLVSERTSHRICEYDMQTGELLRVVVQGPPLASVNAQRFIVRGAAVTTIQAQPVVAPEGLYVMDDWLYFASEAMQQVKRIDLVTGEIQVVVPSYVSGKNQYMKIAVGDGTFGPRGTVFITAWTNASFGLPKVFTPDGSPWAIAGSSSSSTPRGLGGDGDVLDYNAAVACRDGRLVFGSSKEGLVILSAGMAGDPAVNRTLFVAGHEEWESRGFDLLYGDKGFGHYGLPLPWGTSEAIDYFLTWNGHTQ